MPKRDIVRKAIELGRDKGFVNFGELNAIWPSAMTEPEDIEAVMEALSDEGINVIEDDDPQAGSGINPLNRPGPCMKFMQASHNKVRGFDPGARCCIVGAAAGDLICQSLQSQFSRCRIPSTNWR
jgi:RNA polymerase primary sigma factor